MKTITVDTKAWLTTYGNPEDLNKEPEKAIEDVSFSNFKMEKHGWSLIGNATVSFECPDMDGLIQNKVASLRHELQTVRAKAEIEAGDIENKIQKLLAITCEEAA